MIARIWHTGIVAGKVDDYQEFANQKSLPMFRQQKGLIGVQILTQKDKSLVITLWNDENDIHKMEQNPVYIQTVNEIIETGFLTDEQHVEIFEFPLGFFDFQQLEGFRK